MSARSIIRARRHAERRAHRRRRRASLGAALGVAAIAAPAADAASFQVKSILDNGDGACDATCTLRDALDEANVSASPDEITFAPAVTGTITLAGSQLDVLAPLTITGPGSGGLAVSASDSSGVFAVNTDAVADPGAPVRISGLEVRDGAQSGDGGGFVVQRSALTLTDVAVSSNHATGSGGGIFAYRSALTLLDSTVEGNSSDGRGGGVYVDDSFSGFESPLVVSGSTVAGNYSVDAGAGIYADDATDSVLIDRSSIVGNECLDRGAGLLLFGPRGAPAEIVESTISGNLAADSGGGIFDRDVYGLGVSVRNSTISNNRAATDNLTGVGGGIYQGNQAGPLILSSTIVADNTREANVFDDVTQQPGSLTPDPLTIGFSLIETPGTSNLTQIPAGSNLLGVDPGLAPPANNGGLTQTQLLGSASRAVDAGIANGLSTDQRGLPRTVDQPAIADAPGSDGTDMGAVELADTSLFEPSITAKKTQKIKKKVVVKVKAGAGEVVTAEASGSVKAGGKVALNAVTQQAGTDQPATLKLKPKKKKGGKKVLKRLRKGKASRAKLHVELTDTAGNTVEADLTVKLKGAKRKR